GLSNCRDASIAQLVEDRTAGSKDEIRLQTRIFVVLHTVDLISSTKVESQTRAYFPGILSVKGIIVVAVTAAEAGLLCRQSDAAPWSNNHNKIRISRAGELALRIDHHLKTSYCAGQESFHRARVSGC